MTKAQKSLFKKLKKNKHREAFVDLLVCQQSTLGKYDHWAPKYLRKCQKKKIKPIASVQNLV